MYKVREDNSNYTNVSLKVTSTLDESLLPIKNTRCDYGTEAK